jgi:hypothetical protein
MRLNSLYQSYFMRLNSLNNVRPTTKEWWELLPSIIKENRELKSNDSLAQKYGRKAPPYI